MIRNLSGGPKTVKHLRFQPANPYTVQLDLDTHGALRHFLRYLPWFSCIMHETHQELRSAALWRSRNGNWHVDIKLSRPKPVIERIALAAILGSDLARELCNLERVYFKSRHPVLFIEKGNSMRAPRNKAAGPGKRGKRKKVT